MLRVQLLAGGGVFSACVLEALLRLAVRIESVVVPGYDAGTAQCGDLPVMMSPGPRRRSVAALAREAGLPVHFAAGSACPVDGRADLLLVTCYPRRLERAVWTMPRLDCVNLHPSLLPAYRGPAPLFWQLRSGEAETGVTLHRVDERIDAGDIVCQCRVPLPRGAGAQTLNRRLAAAGARLFLAALQDYAGGAVHPARQDERLASYFPNPTASDCEVSADWPAVRAFNFLRGACGAHCKGVVLAGGQRIEVEHVVSLHVRATLAGPLERCGNDLLVQFSPGVVRLQSSAAARLVAAAALPSHGHLQHHGETL